MLLYAQIGGSHWLSLTGVVIAAVAACATLRAVYWAHMTVQDAETNAAADAARHNDQIQELEFISTSAHTAHQIEMNDRRSAFDREQYLRGLAQLQRVADSLRELIDAAREERVHPSERLTDVQPMRRISATPIPALQQQLRIEVRVLKSLGGPDLTDVIPGVERDDEVAGVQRLWLDGLTALERIGGLIDMWEASQPSWVFQRPQYPWDQH